MTELRTYYKDMARAMLRRVCTVESLSQQQRIINDFVRKGDKHFFGFLWAVADESLPPPLDHIKDWVFQAVDAARRADHRRYERAQGAEEACMEAHEWCEELREHHYDVSDERWEAFIAWLQESALNPQLYRAIDRSWTEMNERVWRLLTPRTSEPTQT